ncbi:SpoIID/LytB domain-containing protein [Altericista sp. CCNU0014]|uniref:SpoIID/LytB domain-containing protein n=1 Tax=Altericista sp. CCNU0014 TaxID=3082949 RepID=UPI00384BC3B3
MTKPTVPKFLKYGFWLLPLPLVAIPMWTVARLRPEPNYIVTQEPLPSPSPSVSVFPFLNVRPSATPSAAVSPPQPNPSAPLPSPSKPPVLSKAELARRSQLARAALYPNVDSSVEMHVALASGAASLSIAVSGSGKLFDRQGQIVQPLTTAQSYRVQADAQGMSVGGKPAPNLVWVVPDSNGIFYLGDRGYRGTLLLVADGGQLWAVNYVSLRRYLYSVLGAEVSPSWPPAALKAQAIAARSYALTYYFKPANQLYHLGSDEYYQVYKGIESEADTTRAAVDQTAGSFVSYRGGIVESLYAASDDIVSEAFQGHGMSQLGALKLAEQGYTYEQILKNYYPKTGVGRIEVDRE